MFREIFYNKLKLGYDRLEAESEKQEADKLGFFRGGNSGCMLEDGTILGSDPRVAVLRSLGIQKETTMDDALLFQAGHSNEDNLAQWMKESGMEYLQEEECPVKWEVTSGGIQYPVTGRPDFKVQQDGKDAYGIELKGIFSVGTAMEVGHFLGNTPKIDNVCQAAHYSYKNNKLPWLLVYVNRSWHNVFYFGAGKFPFDHRALKRDDKTGKPITLSPFMTIFDLDWEGDTLTVNGKPTIITASGIDTYYQYLADCVTSQTIPHEHTSINIWGEASKKDNKKKYYDFAEASTDSWGEWIEDCRRIASEK